MTTQKIIKKCCPAQLSSGKFLLIADAKLNNNNNNKASGELLINKHVHMYALYYICIYMYIHMCVYIVLLYAAKPSR